MLEDESRGSFFFSCAGLKFCSERLTRLYVAMILAYLCGFTI